MQAVVEVNPKKLGGVPCFAGTRVPVAYLFIHLAHGGTVDSSSRTTIPSAENWLSRWCKRLARR